MNTTSKAFARWLVAGSLVTLGLLSACVGGSPGKEDGTTSSSSGATASGGAGSSGTASSSGASSGGASSGGESSSGSSGTTSSSSGESPDDGGISDASDAIAPPPPIACTEEVYPPGTYYSSCRANRSSAVAGGTIPDNGVYLLSGYWVCTGGYNKIFGAAQIYMDNGRRVMRYGRIFAATDAVNSEVKGTYEFTAQAGVLSRTERCRAGHEGEVDTGSYTYDDVSLKLTFRFADHDEEWTRQP